MNPGGPERRRGPTTEEVEKRSQRRAWFVSWLAAAAAVIAIGVGVVAFYNADRIGKTSDQVKRITCVTIEAYQGARDEARAAVVQAKTRAASDRAQRQLDRIDEFLTALKPEQLHCPPPKPPKLPLDR